MTTTLFNDEFLVSISPHSFAGNFTNDNEIRLILKAFLVNLFEGSPPIRRTTAICLTSICTSCRKPQYFLSWLLGNIIDALLPLSDGQSSSKILGALTCSRLLISHISDDNNNELLDRLIQLYELCLHFMLAPDHNVVTHSLETLQQLLKTTPQCLKQILVSPHGISRSHINVEPTENRSESLVSSRLSSFALNEDSLLDAIDEQGQDSVFSAASLSSTDTTTTPSTDNAVFPQTPDVPDSKEDPSTTQPTLPEVKSGAGFSVLGDIGNFCDADVPLIYCARKLTAQFLLSSVKNIAIPDRAVRVSIKTLAIGCLINIIHLAPKVKTFY